MWDSFYFSDRPLLNPYDMTSLDSRLVKLHAVLLSTLYVLKLSNGL